MDTPVFHLDGMGNRMLIAIIAITHVIINHPMAVGAYPLICALEWKGIRSGDSQWDQLARRTTFITFLITTSVGALSGVGIWLSSALVSPFGIGTLLRVFFWNWFFEWTVFVIEVGLILAYYLTWDSWGGRRKLRHLALGIVLSLFSWITMAIIVAILGFMMSAGAWSADSSWLSATLNPLYLPQLAFRTFFSLATAGLYVWFLIAWLMRTDDQMRSDAVRWTAMWTMLFTPACMLAAWWYWTKVPAEVAANLSVGLLTQQFAAWQSQFLIIAASVLVIMIAISWIGMLRPRAIPRIALVTTFLLAIGLLGHFERVREFIRKPYVIAGYMYSNGVRVDQLALFQHEGILPHSVYNHIGAITDENRIDAGKHLFLLTCTRCHTTNGLNGVVAKFETLYGTDPWPAEQLESFLGSMHVTRPYMPPFPGNPEEMKALSAYLCELQIHRQPLPGAQSTGVSFLPTHGRGPANQFVAASEK